MAEAEVFVDIGGNGLGAVNAGAAAQSHNGLAPLGLVSPEPCLHILGAGVRVVKGDDVVADTGL